MKRHLPLLLIIAGVALLGAALWKTQFSAGNRTTSSNTTLTVYCAAGLKKPVEEIARAYESEVGGHVEIQFGGTGTLLSQIEVAKRGDLFIAADAGAAADAKKRNLVSESLALVKQTPVIAVKAGNPKGIKGIDDLFRDDVRVAISNPEAASIGRTTKKAVGDRWEPFSKKVSVMKPTVTEIASDLSLGAVDAAVIWDATVPQFKGIEAIAAREFTPFAETASVNVLTACKQPAEALKFARFATASEKGGLVWSQQGFKSIPGDKWAEKPEVILYSGGVNRPAIEHLVQDFANREGITVTTVFNGCGILCSAMKTMQDSANPKLPDAYYACDICFVPPVASLFPEAVLLTETPIVIAVPKGNPRHIKTLADLAQPGLKVGLCNAEQSTLGYMTQGMLKSSGLQQSIMKNVAVQVPTADFLINQMRAGALEAAIVYLVNVQPQAEHIDAVEIQHEGAHAVQPFAVRGDSSYAGISHRMLDFFRANRNRFEQAGFAWRGDGPPMQSKDIQVPDWLKQ